MSKKDERTKRRMRGALKKTAELRVRAEENQEAIHGVLTKYGWWRFTYVLLKSIFIVGYASIFIIYVLAVTIWSGLLPYLDGLVALMYCGVSTVFIMQAAVHRESWLRKIGDTLLVTLVPVIGQILFLRSMDDASVSAYTVDAGSQEDGSGIMD